MNTPCTVLTAMFAALGAFAARAQTPTPAAGKSVTELQREGREARPNDRAEGREADSEKRVFVIQCG